MERVLVSAEIELDVNGERRRVRVEGDTPLLAVLRNDLGLTAAKYGCGLEQCCATPVEQFVGRRIVTVEGLGADGALHPVQRAFLEEEAAQCGYCIPGMIVGAVALLERNPAPGEEEIREALEPHLCRCGTHWRIINAVRRAAAELA
jgi:nicotinate dehydrogenase subunit A